MFIFLEDKSNMQQFNLKHVSSHNEQIFIFIAIRLGVYLAFNESVCRTIRGITNAHI